MNPAAINQMISGMMGQLLTGVSGQMSMFTIHTALYFHNKQILDFSFLPLYFSKLFIFFCSR